MTDEQSAQTGAPASPAPIEQISKFANTALPSVQRTAAGLEPYSGPWGFDQIAHLLRRTMFGPSRNDSVSLLPLTRSQIVELLLAAQPAPDPPLNVNANDTAVPVGTTWINAPTNTSNGSRNSSLKSWWAGLMLNQPISLVEKMTLFWQNHYVSETDVVNDARWSYRQLALFRQNALGNFKNLTKLATIDGAMLRYLNGNSNTKTNPNENYARELQELLTIGKGPEIAPGNYTNYTEDDVKAAAKVLTGWRENGSTLATYFTLSRHDTTNKQFSADYGNTVVNGSTDPTGNAEIDAMLTMIFAQPETARFICRKLYRWFVYYIIDAATETNIIEPLAVILRANNYDITPVLRSLLNSAHFYDQVNAGCVIKSPIELTLGMCRQFSFVFPDDTDYIREYAHWTYIRGQATTMQMDLINQPNVAGWPAYYQLPQFYEIWINSDTLPKRNKFTDTMMTTGHSSGGFKVVADAIAFASQFSSPGDPNALIDEASQLLFPIAITANQKTYLKSSILIPGLGDYEWTAEWGAYVGDPTDPVKKGAVNTRLKALFGFMLDMPEYQLT